MKKHIAGIIVLALLVSAVLPSFAFADSTSCVVLGADISEEQINYVYSVFGIQRGTVPELKVTNAEERTYLEGLIDDSVIGHNSISCVYVKLLGQGSGITVRTNNITWCSSQMYSAALTTAGVTDAEIIVAAPFEVSGTAALTGIYKAYESLTGNTIADIVKQISTEELTTTGDLSELIGSEQAQAIINELKLALDETKNMSDSELRSAVTDIAASYGVVLDDSEMDMVVRLCRQFENLDTAQLTDRLQNLGQTIQKINQTKETVQNTAEKISSVVQSVNNFFANVTGFFSKLFAKK